MRVPLTVRLRDVGGDGDVDITARVEGLSFRKLIPGGFASASFRLSKPIGIREPYLQPLTQVFIYDARNGSVLWEGRLEEPGRGSDSNGQVWDISASGPMVHASDKTQVLVYIDQTHDGWQRRGKETATATFEASQRPDDETVDALVFQFPSGMAIDVNSRVAAAYNHLRDSTQKIGGLRYTVRAGLTTVANAVEARINSVNIFSDTFSTSTANRIASAGDEFTVPAAGIRPFLRINRTGAATTANDTIWGGFSAVIVQGLRVTKAGAEISGAGTYDTPYVLADQIVADLVGRMLTEFDGANASIDTTSTYQIDQFAYPDGASAAQILDDVMALEPDYFWKAGATTAAGKPSFTWAQWPTAIRYEADVRDGFTSPGSAVELYDSVTVRWRDKNGELASTTRTLANPLLAAAGVSRSPAVIDLADELGSLVNAQRVGDQFLAQHQYPTNSGSLTVASPVYDTTRGCMVAPHEIEPGYNIRVTGVTSYKTSLNTSTRDGATVFRVVATEYSSDGGTATLDLDTPAQTIEQIIAQLSRKRSRKR